MSVISQIGPVSRYRIGTRTSLGTSGCSLFVASGNRVCYIRKRHCMGLSNRSDRRSHGLVSLLGMSRRVALMRVGNGRTRPPQEVLISFHRSACGQRPLDIDFMAKRPKECQTMERKKSLGEAMGRVL